MDIDCRIREQVWVRGHQHLCSVSTFTAPQAAEISRGHSEHQCWQDRHSLSGVGVYLIGHKRQTIDGQEMSGLGHQGKAIWPDWMPWIGFLSPLSSVSILTRFDKSRPQVITSSKDPNTQLLTQDKPKHNGFQADSEVPWSLVILQWIILAYFSVLWIYWKIYNFK